MMSDVSGPQTHDPFDVLRRPDAPLAPSATFAKQLRQRLTAELRPLLSRAATSTSDSQPERTATMTVTPYLIVRNAVAALDFYRDAFGAVETLRMIGDDGRVGHAEIMIGGSKLMMADEYPEIGALGPESRGGPTSSFDIDVVDAARVDETFQRALSFGATSLRPPADQFHGSRSATVSDPFGQNWTFSALIEQLSAEEYASRAATDTGHGSFTVEATSVEATSVEATPGQATTGAATATPDAERHQVKHHAQGDLYYFALPATDIAKAHAFFGAVLGWQFAAPDRGHIENISAPPGSVNSMNGETAVRLWFVVDDIHAAVQRVREMGGTADEPVDYASGWSADCTDDQGTMFSLSVPVPEYTA